MTARRAALIPAALAAAFTAASFVITFRRSGILIPDVIAWLEDNYPETETP